MRRSCLSSHKLIAMLIAIAFALTSTMSEAVGQLVEHAGFTYFEGEASFSHQPSAAIGYGSPFEVIPVGFSRPLGSLMLRPGYEVENLESCDEGCGQKVRSNGLLSHLFTGRNPSGYRSGCLFCSGDRCGICMNRLITLPELFDLLRPYSYAGLSAMRWYDASVEATFLSHGQGGPQGIATTAGVAGSPVMDFSDAETGDSLKGGVRLSAALVFGSAANMEVTYMGGNEWNQTAVAESSPAGSATLYSLISNFGTSPNGGFDDTDRSISQSVRGESKFHSGEWNYRRRSMGPYGRFQTSWLIGLRYLRFDSELNYSALGLSNNTVNLNLPRFFSSSDKTKNNLFGPQAGMDLWWNLRPGINVGVGVKGAWVQNDSKRQTIMTGNSLNGFATSGSLILEETRRKGTVLGELEATLIYRLSQSWSAKASYHLLAADDVVFGSVDVPAARDFISGDVIRDPRFIRESLVIQGATFGAEYMW